VLVNAVTPAEPTPRPVRTLAVLSDSIGVGVGDRTFGGGWRGFAPLLANALGAARLVNLSFNGARIGSVRAVQLPIALRVRPEAAVLMVGMNDTMRSDFDRSRLRTDLGSVVSQLVAAGTTVVTIRYHDHSRVFRLPGPLRRALATRIDQLNSVFDDVVQRHGVPMLDLDRMPGAYHPATWSVDRLHPSELGHRLLAREFAHAFADAGLAVPGEVSLACAGGAQVSGLDHVAWLVLKGIPWLLRRGSDIVPHVVSTVLRTAWASRASHAEQAWEKPIIPHTRPH
jgi:lysophospholipase L1-like esterase